VATELNLEPSKNSALFERIRYLSRCFLASSSLLAIYHNQDFAKNISPNIVIKTICLDETNFKNSSKIAPPWFLNYCGII
jgi:hypothetical protein